MTCHRVSRAVTALVGAACLVAATTGCAAPATPASPAASSASAAASTAAALTLTDGYVKAAGKSGDMAMSAIFGTLTNSSSSPITVVSGTCDAAMTVELHEVVMKDGSMKMQQREGGFVVPANGTLELGPGGLHIMLIGLTRDIKAGDPVTAELTLSDGQQVTVSAVGRDLPNANESYAPSPSGSPSHG